MRREEFVPASRGVLFDGSLRPAARALFLKVALEARACGYLEVPGPDPLHVVLQRSLGDTAREWRAALTELTRGPRPRLVEERDADGVRILVVQDWAGRGELSELMEDVDDGDESPDERRRRMARERQARRRGSVTESVTSVTESVTRHAASVTGQRDSVTESVTGSVTCHADVTPPSHTLPSLSDPQDQERDPEHTGGRERDARASERDSERDTERDSHAASVTESVTKPPRRKPEQPLPEDWQPTEAHRKIAAEQGVSVETEAAKMRDWAAAGAHRARDWDARFRLWLRNATPRLVSPLPIPDSWEPSQDTIAKARASDPAFGDPSVEVARFREWARSKGERAADWDARFVAACASRARTRPPAHARPGRVVQSAEGAILRPPPPLPEGSGADLLAAWDAGMEA
jgi:hypothetical protein